MEVAENHHGAWKQAAPGWRAWTAPVVLLLAVVGFYWKITLTRQYFWMDSPDLVYQVLPWYQFQAREWHEGRFPLWDPQEWGGQPLIGQAQPGSAYPLNWLLFLTPLRHGRIRPVFLIAYFLLIHYMAALFAYRLCRDLQRNQPASLLAGVAFSLAGWMGFTDWPQMLNGAVWAPLIFLFLLRTARGERPMRNAGISGALLGFSMLSGHHQIPIFVALACGGVWLSLFFRKGRWNPQWLRPAVLFLLLCVLTGALQTFPAYTYGKSALRWVGGPHPVGWNDPVPYLVQNEFGMHPFSILGILIPGFSLQSSPFLGLVVVTLATLGLVYYWREPMARLLAAVALGGLLFALARFSLLHGLLYSLVPMVEKARNSAMAIFIFHFGFIILSAYGIDAFSQIEDLWKQRIVRWLLAFAAIGSLASLAAALATQGNLAGAGHGERDLLMFSVFLALLLALLLHSWRTGQLAASTARILLILLVLFEAGIGNSTFGWHHKEQEGYLMAQLGQHADILAFLQRDPGPFRAEVDSNSIPYNWGDWQGMNAFDTYLASLTRNIVPVQGGHHMRMLYGNKYLLSRNPSRAGQVEVFSSQSGVKVFANPEAFPRVWTVHKVVGLTKPSEIGPQLDRPLAELRQQAFIEGAPPRLETCALPDRVRLTGYESNRVAIEAELGCRGMVILGDTFDAGWRATVDGQPAPILPAYSCLRGIVAGPGRHRIEMRYRPSSVYWGACFTALGLAVAGFLALRRG